MSIQRRHNGGGGGGGHRPWCCGKIGSFWHALARPRAAKAEARSAADIPLTRMPATGAPDAKCDALAFVKFAGGAEFSAHPATVAEHVGSVGTCAAGSGVHVAGLFEGLPRATPCVRVPAASNRALNSAVILLHAASRFANARVAQAFSRRYSALLYALCLHSATSVVPNRK